MKAIHLTWASVLLTGIVFVAMMKPATTDERVPLSLPSQEELITPAPERSNVIDLSEAIPDSIQEVIRFWARIGEVEFPHLMHSDDFGMACVECHHETNATSLQMPHDEYFDDFWIDCSSCHKSNGDTVLEPQACSDCHHADPTGIADESLSSKVVIHRLCWDCHDSGTGSDASKSCSSCHFGDKTSFMEPLPESQRSQ